MRRVFAILAVAVAVGALLLSGTAAGGDDDVYEVRAIFDNASFLVTGEDVRIAGAKVGSVGDVDVTGEDEVARVDGSAEPGKAAVTLRIDDPGFQDFREDASCLIRPQSLIGEKFVECEPTQPRAAGSPEPPPLEEIGEDEPGEGAVLLPVEQNGKAVDLDLVNNIQREPYPDRFRLILNDLGAGLAARGEELAEIIERSNPALRETNAVLAILARQNRRLAQLSTDSDAILSALARERDSVAGFINESEVTAAATAERSAELRESFEKFPGFLRELRASMFQLERFSDATTPVLADLRAAAPSLTRATKALGPFANAGTDALVTLGDASEAAGPDIVAADPVIRQVRHLAKSGVSPTKNLRLTLNTLRKTKGFEYLADLIFTTSGAVNSFDQYGHFVRALLPIQNCVDYEIVLEVACDQSFGRAEPAAAGAAEYMRLLDRIDPLEGDDSQAGGGGKDSGNGSRKRESKGAGEPRAELELGGEREPSEDAGELVPDAGTQENATPDTAPAPDAATQRATRDLLDFLIGERSERRGSR
jgi:ABC-type transporter Mla subunit MlaD